MDNRLFYIVRGEGDIYINGEKHTLKPDALFLWQRGTAYRFDFRGVNDVISLNFDYTAENSNAPVPLPIIFDTPENKEKIAQIKPIVFEDCPELNTPIILYNAMDLLPAIKDMLNHTSESLTYKDAVLSSKLKLCIIDTLKLLANGGVLQDIHAKVQKVLDYIKSNYQQELTNEKLAEQVGYHPYHLNNMVRLVTGMSLHKNLINHRLTTAERMLISTDASVADIAESVGFSSAMVFIRNFKLKNNMTPSKYREKLRKTI
ncbi:MAG: helix-turn-helix domain-containing protein [Clostridia bacterium]|nr:helix-turn-helix domain-containing protein [Clostridia bacterium]